MSRAGNCCCGGGTANACLYCEGTGCGPWTVRQGTWNPGPQFVSLSNPAHITADVDTTPPIGSTGMPDEEGIRITADVTIGGTGRAARITSRYIDDDNYYFAEIDVDGNGLIWLHAGYLLAGVERPEFYHMLVGDNATPIILTMHVCFKVTEIWVHVPQLSATYKTQPFVEPYDDPIAPDVRIGLASIGGSVTFENVRAEKENLGAYNGDCDECADSGLNSCDPCIGSMPNAVDVQFPTMRTTGDECIPSCDAINGETIRLLLDPENDEGFFCIWRTFVVNAALCKSIWVELTLEEAGGAFFELRIYATSNNMPIGADDTQVTHSLRWDGLQPERGGSVPFGVGSMNCSAAIRNLTLDRQPGGWTVGSTTCVVESSPQIVGTAGDFYP